MKKRIKRIVLSLSLVFLLLIGLSGCGSAPKGVALVVSVPDELVQGEIVNYNSMKVYRILNNGLVEQLDEADYSIKDNSKDPKPQSELDAGITTVTITDKKMKDPQDKKKPLQTTFKFIGFKADAQPIKPADSFIAFQYNLPKNEKGRFVDPIITHQIGYTFNLEKFTEQVKVLKVEPSEDGSKTVVNDITAEVAADLSTKEYDPIYKVSNYTIDINQGGVKVGELAIAAAGGQKPIHHKSANWFDYILVIPVGWLMQLLSFGGIYGLGILFATIIIRTLAWPIYARTNAMSTNMNEAQPELQRLEAKYRGRTDKESLRQKQMEQMAIYKKYKIGMSSMFLPFLQMPIFIAMYQTVTRILIPGGYWTSKITVRSFLGIDLTIGGHWTSYLLAAIVGGTMFILQWLSQRKPAHMKKTTEHNKDPKAQQSQRTMKIVSFVMIIMMVIFSLQNNALALYWVFGNLFSIGQTLVHKEINRRRYEKKQEETLGGIL